MKHLTILVLLSLPLALSTCRDEDELPPITTEGKNTFGCVVNGKLWLPEQSLGQGATHAEIYKRPDTLAVNIYSSNQGQSIFMSIIDFPDLRVNETYYFTNEKCCGLQFLNFENSASCSYEVPQSGHIKLLKWDPDKNILAGTFEFKAYSDECEDTVVITEGRFDIGEIIN